MVKFTDIFIKRPVLSCVISLLILILGIRSISLLPVRQYPQTEDAVIQVATAYVGANPALVAGFITTPLENAIAQAEGIDYLTSSSVEGSSIISANLRLNYDSSKALTAINTQVNSTLNQLPPQSQQPSLSITVGQTIDSMYLGFYSKILGANKITDYLVRVVQPKLQSVPGVQVAEILGSQQLALRSWLDPVKMSAFNITPAEITAALASNNFLTGVGRTDGNSVTVPLTARTDIDSVGGFENLILKQVNGTLIRLKDVSNIELGSDNYNTRVSFNGEPAVYVGIKVAPTANTLSVIKNVVAQFPSIQQTLPEGLKGQIIYDSSKYIHSAIKEVIISLLEAFLIVTVVVFLFLGSARSVIIPVVAIPLSLIGTFFLMLVLHYSINLLTLLALSLAIGLVVDDAIIIVENIQRHIEEGKTPLIAALEGARELSSPIISISVVLIAVYIPIGFMGGLTGALFSEFAFTLAAAVAISALVALTLSPMMCAKFLKNAEDTKKNRFIKSLDSVFSKLQHYYNNALSHSLNNINVTLIFVILILVSNYFLYISSKSELSPQEDLGVIINLLAGPPNAALPQTHHYALEVSDILKKFPETDEIFQVEGANGLNTSTSGMVLKPWDQRQQTSNQLQPQIQKLFNQITGVRVAAIQPPSLPGGGAGLPIQLVLSTTDDLKNLNQISQLLLEKAKKTGKFIYIDTDLKIDKAQMSVQLDRDKAAILGLNMQQVGSVLESALSENYVNYFNYYGRSYKVIPQIEHIERLNPEQILNYYIKASEGLMVPLSTIAQIRTEVVPESINHFQQLNSATFSAVAMPGVTTAEALHTLENLSVEILPPGYNIDYAAQSRQYKQESNALAITFIFSLLIIFLCLAAQFESFRDPFIVLISVPMSICGSLIFISLGIGGLTLNIYTEVGLVTLIGLISKHGILIVQFANDLQANGHNKLEAIKKAAEIRLRPILMTTGSMVLGVIPLILASGAGAASRYAIGIVIATGIAIGTLFTLFVVPSMYLFLAATPQKPRVAT